MACKHKDKIYLYLHGPAEISGGMWSGCGCDAHTPDAVAIRCNSCRAWLPMGPATPGKRRR